MTDNTSAAEPGGTAARGRADATKRADSPKRSGTFIYPLPSAPLPSSTPMANSTPTASSAGTTTAGSHASDRNPAGGVGAGTPTEGTSTVSTSTNGTTAATNGIGAVPSAELAASLPSASGPAAGPARRNSMGQASVRIAARLAQSELATRNHRGLASDPTVDNDELLSMLGEYLLAGGLEKPEIHATLGGQPIVVDLQAPQRPTR